MTACGRQRETKRTTEKTALGLAICPLRLLLISSEQHSGSVKPFCTGGNNGNLTHNYQSRQSNTWWPRAKKSVQSLKDYLFFFRACDGQSTLYGDNSYDFLWFFCLSEKEEKKRLYWVYHMTFPFLKLIVDKYINTIGSVYTL